eukprot:TRINITY_DN1026_c0_g1_i1.p1 TRINITY_DN1026_c0_g1~~TRINITY_DN1026_c0_g1_i1.p1  ORF type:complete len:711 (-),score=212.53 TRINITY_DN1026_c0_g1_i1:69-2201(-)
MRSNRLITTIITSTYFIEYIYALTEEEMGREGMNGIMSWTGLVVMTAVVVGGYYLYKSQRLDKRSSLQSQQTNKKEKERIQIKEQKPSGATDNKETEEKGESSMEVEYKTDAPKLENLAEDREMKEKILKEENEKRKQDEREKERMEHKIKEEEIRRTLQKKKEEEENERREERLRKEMIEEQQRKEREALEAEKERQKKEAEQLEIQKLKKDEEERERQKQKIIEERIKEEEEQRIREERRKEDEEKRKQEEVDREVEERRRELERINDGFQIPDDLLASLEGRDNNEQPIQFDLSNLKSDSELENLQNLTLSPSLAKLDEQFVHQSGDEISKEPFNDEEMFNISSMPSMRGKKGKKTMKMFEDWSKPNKNSLMAELGLLSDDSPPDFERKEITPPLEINSNDSKPSRLLDLFRPPTSIPSDNVGIKNELKTTVWNPGMPVVGSFGVREDMNKKGLRRSKKMSMKFGTMTGGVQEDANFAAFPWNGDDKRAIFSVYDGHAGKNCAETAIQRFPEIFKEKITEGEDQREAFLSTFEQLDNELISFEYEGCTATSLYIWQSGEHRFLQCANVGDSTAFLKREEGVIALSKDHKATDPDERKRIVESGIEFAPHQTRVGGLAVSRALGDHFLKQEKLGVISIPYVSSAIQLEPTDTIIVLASDGLWDVMSGADAIQYCMNYNNAEDMASELIKKAFTNLKCTDNITVTVILL